VDGHGRRAQGESGAFASLDIPAPGLMAPFVAVTGTAGGVLLIVGGFTPLVGAALAADMLVALATAHLGHGFFVSDGGFELELLLGVAASPSCSRVRGASASTRRSAYPASHVRRSAKMPVHEPSALSQVRPSRTALRCRR
jgi:DoxX